MLETRLFKALLEGVESDIHIEACRLITDKVVSKCLELIPQIKGFPGIQK
jgi:hypothetical protein